MSRIAAVREALAQFPRVEASHAPTPVEALPRLGAAYGLDLWVKRDDCTGIAFGGNKVRQLEFYIGAAQAKGADTLLITSAVQSNFMRTAAAMGRRYGMDCHVQLEDRVPDTSALYQSNGNVLLDKLFGATFHSYPEGEDEAGADASVAAIAEGLKAEGKTPYVIPLGADSAPTGALGYVAAALELVEADLPPFDDIIVSSGSALTHAGLLLGLRALGDTTPVYGICVRRDAVAQSARVAKRTADVAALMGLDVQVPSTDVRLFDGVLAPGYGQLNNAILFAIKQTAQLEGLLLDPVYTGKAMAGALALAKAKSLAGRRVLFWHTGGTPALFAYADQLV
jgi:D-cysteine desulfhydrase family pyridoxal phosphate-dependent enzyme